MSNLLTNPTFIEQLAEKLRAIGSLKAVGDTWVSFDSSVPAGGVPFCGQTVSRTLYADLWAWAQQQGKVKTETEWQAHATANGGNCPYYSDGDGSTTFRMPCVLGYMKGANVTTEGGTYKPQKLLNLKGEYSARKAMGSVISESRTEGVFEKGEQVNSNAQIANTTGNASSVLLFNAHNYDDRYQDGADVQPETYQVLVGVYAVGVIQNINNTDVQQLQTGLATLEANAVKSVNGVTPVSGNVNMPHWGSPNNEIIEVTQNEFTAPSDGLFSCYKNQSVEIILKINGIEAVKAGDFPSITIPCKKGDVISLTNTFSFAKFSKCS